MPSKTMQRTPLLLALCIMLVFFSGCTEPPVPDDEDPEAPSNEEEPKKAKPQFEEPPPVDDEEEDPQESEPNRAPTLEFSADVGRGSVPLTVNFTVNVSDPDDDFLSWTLDFGDNATHPESTTDSAIVNHTYGSEGNHTAVVSVSDGDKTTDAQIVIMVANGSGPVPGPIVYAGETFRQSGWGCMNSDAPNYTVDPDMVDGPDTLDNVLTNTVDRHHSINASVWGWQYMISPDHFELESVDSEGTFEYSNATGTIQEDWQRINACPPDSVAHDDPPSSGPPHEPGRYTLTLMHPDYQVATES